MAEKLDPKDLVTLEELAISTMWETSALVELLERKGILTKQKVLAMIQQVRWQNPPPSPKVVRDVRAWREAACTLTRVPGSA